MDEAVIIIDQMANLADERILSLCLIFINIY